MKFWFATLIVATVTVGITEYARAVSPRNTLVIQRIFAPTTLDPAQSYEADAALVLGNVYETLFTFKQGSISEYAPLLATSYRISPDGKRYTFGLRRGVTFHSGNLFSCRDVEYSFERALVVNHPTSSAWYLAESMLGTSLNAADSLGESATSAAYSEYWSQIDRAVQCVNSSTVRFLLPTPDASFFAKLLSPVASIVDSRWAIAHGMWDGTEATWRDWVGAELAEYFLHDHVSGTGAYRLVNWSAEALAAERFDHYWGGTPALENVLVQNIEEESARVLAMKRGDADVVFHVERATLSQLRGLTDVNIYEQDTSSNAGIVVFAFNQNISSQDNPNIGSGRQGEQGIIPTFFADLEMRRCLALSFDQNIYVKDVLQGYGKLLTMALPPALLGYASDLPLYEGNPLKARQACIEAHDGQIWDHGFSLSAIYPAGSYSDETVLEIIKANVEALNPKFHIGVRALSWPAYLNALDKGEATIFTIGLRPDYPDPDNVLNKLYASDGLFSLYTHFSDPEMDALLQRSRSIIAPRQRQAIIKKIGVRAHRLIPLVPLPLDKPFLVARSSLNSIYYNPVRFGSFLWKEVSKD